MPIVRLWVREDGEQPKAQEKAPGAVTTPAGPGLVVDVEARGADDARALLGRAAAEDADEQKEPQRWLEQRAARRRVRPLARFVLDVDPATGKEKVKRGELTAADLRLGLQALNAQAKE